MRKNAQPLLDSALLSPDFSLKWSDHGGLYGSIGLFVTESWAASGSRFVYIKLYALRSGEEALKWARGVYCATTQERVLVGLQSPTLGSFSGQPIGEVCWVSGFRPRARFNEVSNLVVVQGGDLFSVMLVGEQVEDAQTESLALFLVERLKVWPRPPNGFFVRLGDRLA